MTDPMLSAYKGIGSLAGPGMSISNVLGDVVKSAGNILGDVFSSSRTPTTFPDSGGYDFESIYSDPYRGNSTGDIYSTGDYIF